MRTFQDKRWAQSPREEETSMDLWDLVTDRIRNRKKGLLHLSFAQVKNQSFEAAGKGAQVEVRHLGARRIVRCPTGWMWGPSRQLAKWKPSRQLCPGEDKPGLEIQVWGPHGSRTSNQNQKHRWYWSGKEYRKKEKEASDQNSYYRNANTEKLRKRREPAVKPEDSQGSILLAFSNNTS